MYKKIKESTVQKKTHISNVEDSSEELRIKRKRRNGNH